MEIHHSLINLFLVDIETVPQAGSCKELPEESRKLFFDKISKTMPESFDEEEAYLKKAGILAEFAKVICISTGFFYKDNDDELFLKINSISGHDEKEVLRQFIEIINRMYRYNPHFQFAGHNIREFDMPFLCRRMIINDLPLPLCLQIQGAKPWDIKWVDTLQWWRFGDYKNYTSLALLACTLGIPTSKDDIDGSQVQHVYYKENDLQRIAAYCEKDVIVVARIIQKFWQLPLIANEKIIYTNKKP